MLKKTLFSFLYKTNCELIKKIISGFVIFRYNENKREPCTNTVKAGYDDFFSYVGSSYSCVFFYWVVSEELIMLLLCGQ